jgi:hypothetical protein
MAAIEKKDAQIAAAAAKVEAARAKIVAEAAEAAAAIELQRALAKQQAAIDAALAAEQVKIAVAAAAAAEAKMVADEAAIVAEAAVIEQQHAIAEAQAATDAAAAVLAKQQHEFAEAVVAAAVAAAAMVATVAFGACAEASVAFITEKANTRPLIVEQAKAHQEEKQHKHALKLKEKVMQPQRKQPQQQQQQQKGPERGQQTQQNHVYCSSRFEIFTISEEFEMHETFQVVALEVPAAPAATTAPIKAPAAPIKASRPHCPTASTAATAATGSCRLGCNRILNCNRTRVNANITTKNVVKVKLANVLAEARYLGAAVAPKLQSSARQPFVSAHSKVVKANANINTNVVHVHAPQLAGKHVAPMIVNAARVAKARSSMAFGSTTARFAAAAR